MANAKSGFLSATLTSALGAPLAFTVDNQTQNATVIQYDNGNTGLSAPDISPTKTQDQVTLTGSFTQQIQVQSAGGFFATGVSAAGASVTMYQGRPTLDLQYSDFGLWTSAANATSTPQVLGVYAVGNATPAAGLPKTGSVVFTGNALGTIASTQGSGVFGGLATLTVNFASDTLTGSVSDIRAAPSFTSPAGGYVTQPMGSVNAIGFSGSVTGSTFSGQASATGAAGTVFDIAGATGSFGGGFYGSNATEAAGVFSLTGGSTQAQVIGSFGATQSFASNDISPAVSQLSALPNGTPLTASFGTGFVSATQTVVTTGTITTGFAKTTSLAIDNVGTQTGATTPVSVPPATFVYYSNGTIGLQAPDIPYFTPQQTTNNNQTVQFTAASFNQAQNASQVPVGLPYGTVEASGTSSIPGFPSNFGDQVTLYRVGGAVGLQYADFGEWTTGQQVTVSAGTTTTAVSSYGFYGVGVPTPAAQMPTTGSALYTGVAVGVLAYNQASNVVTSTAVTPVTGVAEVNANFATNALTGGIVGLRAPSGGSSPAYLSDIVFTGTIVGSTFSGKTAVGTNASSINLSGSAGSFGGGFYGPNAKEIAGTFSLSGGTSVSLIGSFGAHK